MARESSIGELLLPGFRTEEPFGTFIHPRPAPDRFYVAPTVGPVGHLSDSTIQEVEWQRKGWVIGMAGCTLGDGSLAGMASIGVRIQRGTTQAELATTGQVPTFALFAALFGFNGTLWRPISIPVKDREKWFITYHNFHPATDFTPYLHFEFSRHRPWQTPVGAGEYARERERMAPRTPTPGR